MILLFIIIVLPLLVYYLVVVTPPQGVFVHFTRTCSSILYLLETTNTSFNCFSIVPGNVGPFSLTTVSTCSPTQILSCCAHATTASILKCTSVFMNSSVSPYFLWFEPSYLATLFSLIVLSLSRQFPFVAALSSVNAT